MGNLALQVHRHISNLQILHVTIEQLHKAIEIKTSKAREELMTYRDLKQQAESALDIVSEDYRQALNLFQQSDALFEKLKEIKAEHIVLSETAVKRAKPESIAKLQKARKQLRGLYGEIEKLKAEGLPSASLQFEAQSNYRQPAQLSFERASHRPLRRFKGALR